MPADAPVPKRRATEDYGGEVVPYDREREDREAIGQAMARDRGLVVIPPYDHPHIIAGQGTAARELFDEVGPLDFLFVPCGGGGLLSGSALAARHLSPQCQVIGVEPEDAGEQVVARGFLRSRVGAAGGGSFGFAAHRRAPSLELSQA